MLLKTSEIYVALYDFHLLPHEAEVAKISITKIVAKAVPDGKVWDEDQQWGPAWKPSAWRYWITERKHSFILGDIDDLVVGMVARSNWGHTRDLVTTFTKTL